MRNEPRRTPGRLRAVVYAVLVHVAVIAALVVGFRWTHSPSGVVVGKPIKAVVAEDPQKKKLEEQKKREQEAREKAEAEKKRQAEEEARKQKEEEEARQEAERKQAEAEKQRQAELKRKQEEEARKQVEAEKKRQAEEAARKQAEAEQRQKAAEQQLQQQLDAEEQARAEAARAARAASEADKYKALIRQKVSRYWSRPPGAKTGLRCTVHVQLAPGGDVLQATVVKGSGNPLFDRSVEAAVFKASPLPIPPDPDLFDYFREIEFLFNPEG